MAEHLNISSGVSKDAQYQSLIPQLESLVAGEEDLVANMANVSAALMTIFKHLWIGFYIVKGDELVLGPFQGPIACTRIQKGKGVCGAAWEREQSLVVSDVDDFPGHIACSTQSKSEIVVPIKNAQGEVIGVLDIDSSELDTFDEIDQKYLERLVSSFS
ncbi:MAG: GAF domain-containing protein [Cyclobacteriaceae bacterium]